MAEIKISQLTAATSANGSMEFETNDAGTSKKVTGDQLKTFTNSGLGTLSTQNASSVSITGGSITGITDLAVADGGTGASTAPDARTNLGLGTIATQNSNSVSITGGSITGISDLAVVDGGTGASTLTGYVKGSGTAALTASSTIPNTDITGLGTMSTQAASSVAITGGSINGTTVGATTASTGAFTTLSASSTVSGTGFSTYLASPPAIGGTAPAAGSFTTLAASSTVSGTGFSNYLASPPAIGGTAAAAGSFTTLSASGDVNFTGTGAVKVPTGTTAQRPTAATGDFRYNTSISKFEGYNGTAWGTVGGGATGGGSDDIFIENGQTVTTNYTLTTNKNAMSAGPITVNSGITVTVPSGSRWVIV